MSILVEMTRDQAAAFAYGMLWNMRRIDRYTHDGRCASDARVALNNVLTMEEKAWGITEARAFLSKHPIVNSRQHPQQLTDDEWRKLNAAWEAEGFEP